MSTSRRSIFILLSSSLLGDDWGTVLMSERGSRIVKEEKGAGGRDCFREKQEVSKFERDRGFGAKRKRKKSSVRRGRGARKEDRVSHIRQPGSN